MKKPLTLTLIIAISFFFGFAFKSLIDKKSEAAPKRVTGIGTMK